MLKIYIQSTLFILLQQPTQQGLLTSQLKIVGACAALAATVQGLSGYEGFNVVGPEVPTVHDVLNYLHDRHELPRPHFSVPFPVAFTFAWLMEMLDPFVPWEPLITRSIVHLLQETAVDNSRAMERLGYAPKYHWKQAVDIQLAEMAMHQKKPMEMARPLPREKNL
jgi:nucleoside-diphosphate-sugar epimerase